MSDTLARRPAALRLLPPPYRWWHGVLFWIAVYLPGLATPPRDLLFPGFLVPPLRPPAEVFPLVWVFITACTVWAGLRILNARDLPGRGAHLARQGVFWAAFMAFGPVFFGLSSPIGGAVLTALIFAVAAAEVVTLWPRDRMAAALMAPLAVWTGFAGFYLAPWQVLYNPDPFLGVGPLLGA